MPKIRFDLRQSILDLIDQLNKEYDFQNTDPTKPLFVFKKIPHVLTVEVPEKIVEAIRARQI